jgi:hypothetical protein
MHTPNPGADPDPSREVPNPAVPPDMEPVVPQQDPPQPGRPGDGEPPPIIARTDSPGVDASWTWIAH